MIGIGYSAKIFKIFVLGFVLVLMLSIVGITAGYHFKEDFNDGDYTNNPTWHLDAGEMIVVDGELKGIGKDIENDGRMRSHLSLDYKGPKIINGSWEFRGKLSSEAPQEGRSLQLCICPSKTGEHIAITINRKESGFFAFEPRVDRTSIAVWKATPPKYDNWVTMLEWDTVPERDRWYHVKLEHEPPDIWKLYVDGKLKATARDSYFPEKQDRIIIGHEGSVYIDDILIIPKESTTQEHSDNGLVAEWHFDKGKGNIVKDSSGNGNDGIIHGATWVGGIKGKALKFDGKDDYVEVHDSPSLDVTDAITIEAWIYPIRYPLHRYHAGIVGRGGWDIGSGYEVDLGYKEMNGVFELNTRRSSLYSESRIPLNQWTHIAATLKNTDAVIYINGKIDASGTVNSLITNNRPLQIGRRDPGNNFVAYFDGIIDEVRIYNRALSTEEIKAHYEFKAEQPSPTITPVPTTPTPTPFMKWKDWKYQKEIIIKENSGKTLADYQVLVELKGDDFPGKAKSDGADIRFTDTKGKELSYWIESWDYSDKSAKIWVKVPRIPANGETKITMRYGNPNASPQSNGDATFEFFDDFEDGDYRDRWLRTRLKDCGYGHDCVGYATWIEKNGKLRASDCCQNSVYCSQGPAILISKRNFTVTTEGFVLDVTMAIATSSAGHSSISSLIVGPSMYREPITIWDRHFGTSLNTYSIDRTCVLYPPEYHAGDYHPLLTYTLGDPYRHITKYDGSTGWNITIYKNGAVVASKDGLASYSENATLKVMLYVESPRSYFDDVKIRKYASSEPTVTIGTEQPSPTITPVPTTSPSTFVSAKAAIEEAKTKISEANSRGSDLTQAELLLEEAEQALENGDYDKATEFAEQAKEMAEMAIMAHYTLTATVIGVVIFIVVSVVRILRKK